MSFCTVFHNSFQLLLNSWCSACCVEARMAWAHEFSFTLPPPGNNREKEDVDGDDGVLRSFAVKTRLQAEIGVFVPTACFELTPQILRYLNDSKPNESVHLHLRVENQIGVDEEGKEHLFKVSFAHKNA